MAFFIKFLTPGLTREFCNPLDDLLNWLISINHQADYKIRGLIRSMIWLESTYATNHPADYLIRRLSQDLKIW